MLPDRVPMVLGLVLLLVPVPAWGQTSLSLPASPDVVPYRTYALEWPTTEVPSKTDAERQVTALFAPMIADTDRYPVPPETAKPQPWRLFQETKFDATWLPDLGQQGLGITDIEFATTLTVPLAEGWAPLLITPYAAAHYWTGPAVGLGLPPHLYDLNAEFAWRPRLAQWLFVDLAVTPGLYTDFSEVNIHSFQMRGRALGIVAFSEQLQIAAGAMYVNRNQTKVLPAGGVIWNPSEDTRCFLVFPQPKISRRWITLGETQLWSYVAGEFGGGRWEIERANQTADSIDYTDLRVLLGVEAIHAGQLKGHIEVGYVFSRRVNFLSDNVDYRPENTVMLRTGIRF